MNHFVYIIFSKSKQRYYCGETENFEIRFQRHNNGTSKATKYGTPWSIVKIITVENRSMGRKLEKKIKARGISRWIDEDKPQNNSFKPILYVNSRKSTCKQTIKLEIKLSLLINQRLTRF